MSFALARGWIPPGDLLLTQISQQLGDWLYLLAFLVIFVEAIIYLGFYLPGQYFAVLLVASKQPDIWQLSYLTLAMVAAATLASLINFYLGRWQRGDAGHKEMAGAHRPYKMLLLAMVHINALAFFMYRQGQSGQRVAIVALAGLLNLPYYLLLITLTAGLSDYVVSLAENTYFLLTVVSLWLMVSVYRDWCRWYRQRVQPAE